MTSTEVSVSRTKPSTLRLVRTYFRVLLQYPGDSWRLVSLIGLMSAGALFETAAIGLVLPFIRLLQDPAGFLATAPLPQGLRQDLQGVSPATAVLVAGGGLLGFFLLKNTFLAFSYSFQMRFVYRRMVLVSRRLLEFYMSRPYTFHLRRNSAELVRGVILDSATVFTAPIPNMLLLFVELITALVLGIFLVALEPIAIPIAAIVLGSLSLVIQRVFLHRMEQLGSLARHHQIGMLQWANEALAGFPEVQITHTSSYFVERFAKDVGAHAQALRQYRVSAFYPRYLLETVGVAALVVLSVVMLFRDAGPSTLLPVMAVLAVAIVRLLPSATRAFAALADLRYHSSAAQTLAEQLAELGAERVQAAPPAGALSFARDLRLENVGFEYPDAAAPSLVDVSLTLGKGESVALVGPSGAGKTTLAHVIVGLLHPQSGRVLLDGSPLRHDNSTDWQRLIGFIPQTIHLCDDTLRRNIAFGVPDELIDEDTVNEVVETACLAGFVATLPDGLDTRIGERGVRLSGGQRQRIGIARALYRKPEVLVLDEATSALDGTTEREVVDALRIVAESRTTLIIAHRLSTVRNCHRLVLMEKGRVVQSGTWEQLMAANADFRQLVTSYLQALQ